MGLMESICVVCNVQAASRRQTDLLAASRFLLQDLVDQQRHEPSKQATKQTVMKHGWSGKAAPTLI